MPARKVDPDKITVTIHGQPVVGFHAEPVGWRGCPMCNGTGVDFKNSNVMKTIECRGCLGHGRIPVYGD